MNSLEKRLLCDDEEDEEKLDESRWSSNLDALWLQIVHIWVLFLACHCTENSGILAVYATAYK